MRAYLSPKDVLNILKVARDSSTRDWCMFLLTFRHALRSREARHLKIVDVNMENLTITIRRVKGSRSGVQPLDRHKGETTLDEIVALKAWLKERVEDGLQSPKTEKSHRVITINPDLVEMIRPYKGGVAFVGGRHASAS